MIPGKNTIGITANLLKPGVMDLIRDVLDWFEKKNINVIVHDNLAKIAGLPGTGLPLTEMVGNIGCLLVFGGDGTILNCARHVAKAGVPLLGVNLGRIGFLSELDIPEIYNGLESLIRNDYIIEERMMIESAVLRKGRVVEKSTGLNDAVITKGSFSRLIFLRTSVNAEPVITYPADGLIIATPTGSTAYSLSAGGPIVTPELNLILVTPICPHALSARPIVISADCIVEVELLSGHSEVMLTLDGQYGMSLIKGDIIKICKAPYKVKFIRIKNRNFFRVLNQKLRENGPS